MSKLFQANLLILKTIKTQVLKFTSAKLPNALNLTYTDHLWLEVETITFWGLQWDNQISLKNHIQFLLRKLSSACYLMRRLYYNDSTKLIYFVHFCSLVICSIIFWDNQHDVNNVFILQKEDS
jgi:hypothetical protein